MLKRIWDVGHSYVLMQCILYKSIWTCKLRYEYGEQDYARECTKCVGEWRNLEMGDKSYALFLFYKVKFVHLFNMQFTMTCQFKALNYNTVELFIHFSYAHFEEKEIILISTSYSILI